MDVAEPGREKGSEDVLDLIIKLNIKRHAITNAATSY